ncbi:nucleotide disphospho-sugar-binding domain-containing protein [Micromonospora auratinigra]|uniref:UDP:flavonoid glycosyltransferase YjiC, YdhE family n=1 Tax=Micromonospora auratinigra TaxID=261654 RepID=A0A1A8ZG16_9ACTN|nr:nucleotide disphospho-sugar-binding domain-containing protein [Micromonospora auratinigra]SBT42818.1 UDP:flavonoid glycosyltransferase YjiC, YdhE family [Micromonospora auratinigra]
MRVLFTTSNWGGHYFSMVPLGWALQAAGHEVRVACVPAQVPTINRTGLVPVPVLDSPDTAYWARLAGYQEALDAPEGQRWLPLHPVTGKRVHSLDEFDVAEAAGRFYAECAESLARSYDAAVEFGRRWQPDLVCYDLMSTEGALVGRLQGVPAVYCPPGLFGAVETETGIDMGLDDPTGSFARHGAAPWSRDQIEYVVDPSPESALPPHGAARRLPVRYVPYNGPGGVPEWALTKPAGTRIAICWGYSATAMYGVDAPALPAAVAAAVATGAEVVLTASPEQVEALGELPPSVRVLRDFPLHLLLAVSDAVIHHGGASHLMTGAAAGIPQLALSMATEQITFGERIARTGAVISLPGRAASATEIELAVKALTGDPAYAAAARSVRAELDAHPTPAELVRTLAELAGR